MYTGSPTCSTTIDILDFVEGDNVIAKLRFQDIHRNGSLLGQHRRGNGCGGMELLTSHLKMERLILLQMERRGSDELV